MSDLHDLLADAHCRVPADVQKKAKARWKATASPELFELVKKKFRTLKSLDWEVSEQLEELEKAVRDAKLEFDVPNFAGAIRERSTHATPPLGSTYLFSRDVVVAREVLLSCLDTQTKTLNISVSMETLPDTLFDALPAVREVCAFENLELSVGTLSSHRLPELMAGVLKLSISLGQGTLPAELFTDQLIWFTLISKKVTELPEEIGHARNVWMLDVDAPKVKKLPKAIGTLPLRSLSLAVTLPALDVSIWPTLRYLYLKGAIKKLAGLDKLPVLEEYTQRCGAPVPDAIWKVTTLTRVWFWYDGFDDFDEVKAKFEARGIKVEQ